MNALELIALFIFFWGFASTFMCTVVFLVGIKRPLEASLRAYGLAGLLMVAGVGLYNLRIPVTQFLERMHIF